MKKQVFFPFQQIRNAQQTSIHRHFLFNMFLRFSEFMKKVCGWLLYDIKRVKLYIAYKMKAYFWLRGYVCMKGKGNAAKRESRDILWFIPLILFIGSIIAMNIY